MFHFKRVKRRVNSRTMSMYYILMYTLHFIEFITHVPRNIVRSIFFCWWIYRFVVCCYPSSISSVFLLYFFRYSSIPLHVIYYCMWIITESGQSLELKWFIVLQLIEGMPIKTSTFPYRKSIICNNFFWSSVDT